MPKRELWVWLNAMHGMNDVKINNLLDRFGDVDQIYAAKEADYADIPSISPKDIANLCDKSPTKANNIIRIIKSSLIKVITFDDENYPVGLRQLPDPPHILYVKGNLLNFSDSFMISVVGTRTNSQYGAEMTYQIAGDLAKAGVVTVSGMARGIDTVAHRATLDAGGKTVAVLGCGLDVVYPPENKALMDEICQSGAVMTEFPPTTPPLAYNFPKRNRIVACLSSGTLVVEGSKSSGSLITARLAIDNSRDLFAIPGNAGKYTSEGTNMLIQNCAKLVSNANDILSEYPNVKFNIIKETTKPEIKSPNTVVKKQEINLNDSKYSNVSPNERALLELILSGNTNIEQIFSESSLSPSDVNSSLTLLEIKGLIRQTAGKNYEIA